MTDTDRLAAHKDDSYGNCIICREWVPHTDDEYVLVEFPCPTVLLAAERERIAAAVKGLPSPWKLDDDWCQRSAVLAIVRGEKRRRND